MNLGLRDRVAIVTGASQGLGRATARALAAEGARVAICSRNADGLQGAAAEIRQSGSDEVLTMTCDVTRESDIAAFVQAVYEAWGPAEILVNNTGGPPAGTFEDLSVDQWHTGIELNLVSVVRFCQAVVPQMKKRKWGRIVNITSIAAKQPVPGLMLSNATRAGVLGFSKTLANEIGAENITVNSVCPGYTRTDRLIELAHAMAQRESISVEEVYRRWEEAVPMKRLGRPEDVANLITFLCSDLAGYLTGCAIQVDGGLIKSTF